MADIHIWIDKKLAEVAKRLPKLVDEHPESFLCGYNTGFKQCLIEIDLLIRDDIDINKDYAKCT